MISAAEQAHAWWWSQMLSSLEDDPEVKGMLGSVENSNRYMAQFPFKMYVRP